MGLIKAIGGAIDGVMADQWKEYFYCEAIPADVLVTKGRKRVTDRGTNTKGVDNIITNGSIISVADGQCMIIVDNGKVVDLSAEPGEFKYDSSTEPSLLDGGNLGSNIKAVFANVGKRFTFGGEAPKDQRIYYFNTKEIMGNKYGTPSPVPFRVVDANVGLDTDISIKCFGEYSYRITNPMLFYANVCGNISQDYERSEIDSQLKTEVLTSLGPALAQISEMGIRYSALPGHQAEIANALNQVLSENWRDKRGIEIFSFGVSSVKASEEDEQMIKELQKAKALSNAAMGAGFMTAATGDAMKAAASNTSGAAMAFMGMGMAQNAGGVNATQLYGMAAQQQAAAPAPSAPSMVATAQSKAGWTCSCGATATGKFCTECGAKKPEDGWTCVKCGTLNKGKFCNECGEKKPEGAYLYKCDKCGWEPEDPANPPKFCPECGDAFDTNDIVK